MTMTRTEAERIVTQALYGFPPDSPLGLLSTDRLFAELGTAALTDTAMIRLAQIQQDLHQTQHP
ncbi:hypothetical protein CPT_Sansa69 [Caulobacter phage Sansa]|uniref:Uncharacterized protein n=1 Tax=Caulobacter phage Sansa TaxID=1675600 RepID=A0A0K1LMP5_9CAUD|nr:hypothetical protein HOR07_gp069 [Caulobacter phage Sansa]AKU43473.1 hypothetical protein CPT_Sansa69 [Caulobacter phage Sansa]